MEPSQMLQLGNDLRADLQRFVEGVRKIQKHRPPGYYDNAQHFVLENGEVFDHISPHAERYTRRTLGACFYNSRVTVSKSRGKLVYVEGYAYAEGLVGFPTYHAWAVDEDGGVVDTTWNQPGLAYVGVRFPIEYVRQTATANHNSMIDRWHEDWPLLRQKFDPSLLIVEGVCS